MSEQPMDAADRKLLLAIIESASQTPDWNLVAFMVGKTPEAVQYVALFSFLVTNAPYPSFPAHSLCHLRFTSRSLRVQHSLQTLI